MTKVDWLAASTSLGVGSATLVFSLVYRLQYLLANEKQGPVPEEMSQSLLTKKKQVKMCLRNGTTLSSWALTRRNTFYFIKPEKGPKKFKNQLCPPLFMPRTVNFCQNVWNLSGDTVPLSPPLSFLLDRFWTLHAHRTKILLNNF